MCPAGVNRGSERQPNPLQYNIRLSLQTSNQGAHVEDPFTMDISVCGAGALVTTDSDGSRCEPCALGTYNNGSRLQKCHQCPASQYTSTASRAVGCTKCPQGSFTAQPGASSALECRCQPVGWYRSVTGHCERCDASDKTAVCVEWQGSEQVLAEGWWLPASGRHANNTIDSPTRCYETSAAGSPCLGGDAVGRCAVGHQGACRVVAPSCTLSPRLTVRWRVVQGSCAPSVHTTITGSATRVRWVATSVRRRSITD